LSRIEKALEKAVRLRESTRTSYPEPDNRIEIKGPSPLPEFHISECLIDPSKVDRHVVCITDPLSAASEQYRKLRARILAATKQDYHNTIMVTSADVGEGKSITSINFAVALAQEIDHTVLLVDADLRKPSMHRYLGIKANRGLSDYLAGTTDLSDVLIPTGVGKLVLLPAGTPSPNPAELLSSNRMKELVHEMKHRYSDRYIIFDTSPVLVSADAISMSSHVDGILFVIHAATTPEKTVKKAIGLLQGAPILGVVFNNVPDYLGKNLNPYYYYRYHQDTDQPTKKNSKDDKH
jgi:exopolysaccharide/PEP-CTERM locus tyrosine autokinase